MQVAKPSHTAREAPQSDLSALGTSCDDRRADACGPRARESPRVPCLGTCPRLSYSTWHSCTNLLETM